MKKRFLAMFAILLLIVAGCSSKSSNNAEGADTSDYPKKPIELVVPFAPGGSTDVIARAIAKELPNYLPNKQQVAVINKAGAGTTLGLEEIAKSKPDGYTIGLTTSSGLDIQPHYGKTSYQAEDFQPIIKVYELSSAIVVKNDSPIKTFEDWVEYAKKNPGKFTYGTSGGTGSGGNIVMEELSKELGIELKHVPFEGVADVTTAIMGGQIQGGQQKPDTDNGGELRPIAFTTATKGSTDFYKDTPNTEELGLKARSNFYAGFVAAKGTPDEIVTILHDAIKEIIESPEIKDLLEKQTVSEAYAGPEDFATTISEASNKNKELMKSMGLID